MKKSFALKTFFAALFLALPTAFFAFDWPAENFESAQTLFTFSQYRKGRFNQSLVFQNAQAAKATDKGKIIAVITEKQNDGDWFESPLGNTAILSHDDALISVYGNLSQEAAQALLQKSAVGDGESLGATGSSAWSESEEGALEFQIADTNSKSYINPIILMPRSLKPPKISLDGIAIENQFGRIYNLASLRSVPAGVYKVYKRRQPNIGAFKTEVYVNGSEVEKITKETLRCQGGRLQIVGTRDSYQAEDFYPSEDLALMGHALLPHGSNTITIMVSDIFDSASTVTYGVSGY